MSRKIQLAIETALGGGSFSIFEDGRELDFLCNLNPRSTAEDLLFIIEKLLLENSLEKQEVNKIVYSGGPGSRTGIRIGAATAKALSFAFSCECFEVKLLYALTFCSQKNGFIQTGIQTAENEFCLQSFEKKNSTVVSSQMKKVSKNDLLTSINDQEFQQVIIVLRKNDDELIGLEGNVIFFEMDDNFARFLNLSSLSQYSNFIE